MKSPQKGARGQPKAPKRPGIFVRERPVMKPPPRLDRPQTAEEMRAVLRSLSARMSFKAREDRIEETLTQLENEALVVYRRHKLPTEDQVYRVWCGQWFNEQPSPEAEQSLDRPKKRVPRPGVRVGLGELPDALFGPDHEAAFAAAVLKGVVRLRELLARARGEENWLAVEMVEITVGTISSRWMHEIEFVLGDALATELNMRRARPAGGHEKAKAQNRPSEWAAWNTRANNIWGRSPRLAKRRVAALVIQQLNLSEGVETVRKRIHKVG